MQKTCIENIFYFYSALYNTDCFKVALLCD